MQKWEYLELEVEIGGPITKTTEHLWWFKPDGKHFENHGAHGVLMAKLGLEGWELVTGSARIFNWPYLKSQNQLYIQTSYN